MKVQGKLVCDTFLVDLLKISHNAGLFLVNFRYKIAYVLMTKKSKIRSILNHNQQIIIFSTTISKFLFYSLRPHLNHQFRRKRNDY